MQSRQKEGGILFKRKANEIHLFFPEKVVDMRITTNSMMRQYGNRINSALNSLNKAGNKIATGFKYSKSAESPADSARAIRLYTQKLRNENYLSNLNDVTGVLDSMEAAINSMRNLVGEAYDSIELALNGTFGEDDRKIIATELRQIQEAILKSANMRLNDQYLFGGSGTKEPPFTFDASGNLLYRGLSVDDPANAAELKKLAEEKIYVDLGFGLAFESGTNNVISGSAFNKALPGISLLGYGTNSNGYPDNVISTLGMLADELEKSNFDNTPNSETRMLWTHLKGQFQNILISTTQLGTDQKFLETTKSRLEDIQYSLEEKIKNTIGIEEELAITEWQYQQYVYNAILKMGTNILTPSFIDFMS